MRCNEAADVAIRKRRPYYPANFSPAGLMPRYGSRIRGPHGITVLGLVLLVILIVVAIVLLTRYYPI